MKIKLYQFIEYFCNSFLTDNSFLFSGTNSRIIKFRNYKWNNQMMSNAQKKREKFFRHGTLSLSAPIQRKKYKEGIHLSLINKLLIKIQSLLLN